MHDCIFRTVQTLVCTFNQFRPALHQYLNSDIVGNEIVLNDVSYKVIIGLACRGKTHLNFFETHLDQSVEHVEFALWVHGVNQCLVAVT